MSWQRIGQTVRAEYHGNYIVGMVTDSRVKYGGKVQHTVKLFKTITVYGSVRDTVLLEEEELISAPKIYNID